jgi:hypothetical protein
MSMKTITASQIQKKKPTNTNIDQRMLRNG